MTDPAHRCTALQAVVESRDFNPSADFLAVEHCMRELQEFSRAMDNRLPPGHEVSGDYLRELLRRCEAHGGKILVAERLGEIVGYVCVLARVPSAEPADGLREEAQIVDLVVTEKARGCGAGSRLLSAAEDFARSSGARWQRVQVFAWNQSARSLYAKRGFEEFEITLEKPLAD